MARRPKETTLDEDVKRVTNLVEDIIKRNIGREDNTALKAIDALHKNLDIRAKLGGEYAAIKSEVKMELRPMEELSDEEVLSGAVAAMIEGFQSNPITRSEIIRAFEEYGYVVIPPESVISDGNKRETKAIKTTGD